MMKQISCQLENTAALGGFVSKVLSVTHREISISQQKDGCEYRARTQNWKTKVPGTTVNLKWSVEQ